MRVPRVLHVDSARELRGGQQQLSLLLAGLEALCPGSQAVALPPDAPLWPKLSGVGRFPVRFRGAVRGGHGLRQAIRCWRPDLLAVHTSHAHSHTLRVAGRVPVVVHRRLDFQRPWWRGRKYRSAAATIAVSQAVARALAPLRVPAVEVVYDGVNTEPFATAHADPLGLRAELGLPSTARVILAVGALVPHKDHATLVRAMVGLDAQLLIAGEGPLRGALARQARRHAVPLHLLGLRSDVPRLLRSVDLFCHCSREEGLGQAVIEAICARRPLVGTAAGGVPEVIGKHGIIVPVGDPSALRAALRTQLRQPRPVPAEASAAFSVRAMVGGTLSVYRRVVLDGGPWSENTAS